MDININTIRHSLAHILAYAVQELYPGVKFGIGPSIEDGFYYDFGNLKISDSDLPKIEEKMQELIRENIAFKKSLLPKEKAKKIFKSQPYKLKLIKEIEKISVYQSGKFIDLCKGPHLKSTLQLHSGQAKEIIDAFKLTKIAGAYWKGDEKNPMLTRIYGVAFETKKELYNYIKIQEEAEKRDHRKLGALLGLFLIDEEIGIGLPIWLPNGAIVRKIIENYLYEELTKQEYLWLYTPHIGNLNLWKKSGHWDFYKENLYSPIQIDEDQYLLKPMNCPFHVKVYNSKIRSYKDLPLKFAELGTVYRYEKSGVLHGLTRVRGFTQDDAHIICQPGQIAEEANKLVKYGLKMLRAFGFKEYNIYLSTRPEKYAGTKKGWEKATNTLKYVLTKNKLKYQIDRGGGVFYGPKIDIKIKDSLGREWQCTTIQFDFNLPERFNMVYIDKKGKKQEPYMIHRALLGSIERFMGVLIEHYAGAFPLWLSPVQIWIIPVGSRHKKYANDLKKVLTGASSFRVEVKDENETVSKKIRDGEGQKIPYMLVVGDKEMNPVRGSKGKQKTQCKQTSNGVKTKSVRVRQRGKGDLGMMKLDNFIEIVKKEIKMKI